MMTPVGRLVLVRTVDRRELVNAMAWVSIPAMIGPLMGPPLGGFITTYFSWHWIFLINVPIGLDRHRAGDALHRERARRGARGLRRRRHGAVRDRSRGTDVRAVGRGLRDRALARGGGHPADRRCGSGAVHRLCAAGAGADPRLQPAQAADLPGEPRRRLHVPHRRRRDAVPAAAAAAGRVQPDAAAIGPHHLHLDAGRAVHEGRGAADAQEVRLSQRADLRTPSSADSPSRSAPSFAIRRRSG